MARRRRARVPKVVDRFMVAFIAAGLVWIVVTSRLLRCPHTPALVISCVAGGLVLGRLVRMPTWRWRIGPVRVSVGPTRSSGRGPARRRVCRYSQCDQPVTSSKSGRTRMYCGPPERLWPGGKTCKQLAAAERMAARNTGGAGDTEGPRR